MKAESAAYWGFGGQSDEEKDAQVRRSALRRFLPEGRAACAGGDFLAQIHLTW